MTIYPDADPIQHGADRSGLAFGMELEQGTLNATGPAINTALPLDLNQAAITDAERSVIRDILAIRDAAGTEIRNILIGGTGADPTHARLRTILTALNIPNQNVAGHAEHLHVILAAPQAQAALNSHVQTALLNALATLRDEVVDAINMQAEFQNRLFTKHPDDTLETLLPMELAIQKGLHDPVTAYLGSTTSPTVEGLQYALDGLIVHVPIPDSDDILTVGVAVTLAALNGDLQASVRLRASRVAATEQDNVDPRLGPSNNILDSEDALDHILVELVQDFQLTIPLQDSPIADADILVRRDQFEASAKSFNIRDYASQLFVVQLDVVHDPVVMDGTLSITFDDENTQNEITLDDLKDPFLATKVTTSTAHSEFSGLLAVQPTACDWLPLGADPTVAMTDADIFDGVPPAVVTNPDFDLLGSFTTLTDQNLFDAIEQLQAGIARLGSALEPIEGIPFVDSALTTLAEIQSVANLLADSLVDGQAVLFTTIQDLVIRLRTALGLNSEEVYFTCAPEENALYLNLDIQRELALPVDLEFEKLLTPLSISAAVDAELTATLSVDLAVGFDLTAHALPEASYRNVLITELNGGTGITTVAGDDIKVTLRDGTVYTVDIDAANPFTIEDAYDAIVAPSAGDLTYSIVLHPDRDEVVGVVFLDSTSGASVFSISKENNSPGGNDLGVLGQDNDLNGAIQGTLRSRSLQDRVFLSEGGGLQIAANFATEDLDVSVGVFGVGGEIQNGTLEFNVTAGLKLVDPGVGANADERITLRELFGSPVASTVDVDPVIIDGEGRLPVLLNPAIFNALLGIDPNHPLTEDEDGPELTVDISYEFPRGGNPLVIDILPNEPFQTIIDSLKNLSFDSVCGGISQVVAFLQNGEFNLFNEKLPLIDKSVNELIATDSLLSDVIDVLCVDVEQLKLDVEDLLPDLEQPTSPVGALPAIFSSLTTEQQTKISALDEAIHHALGQEDLTGLPTELAGIVGNFRDFITALPNTVSTAQLTAFVNQLEDLLPTLDKIEVRVESALGLTPNDFVMEFVDLDSNPTTFTRGLIMRMTLGAGFNSSLPLEFELDTVDGKIPIAADSGGTIQLGLNGTLQLDFGIDLSEGVNLADRPFIVAYDGTSQEGTRLDLTANVNTSSPLTGSLSFGGIDLVSLGPAHLSFRNLETKSLAGVTSQANYPLSPVIPSTPTNVLDVAFVRVNGQIRNSATYTLAANQLTFTQMLPVAGDVIEILYPGLNPASYTVSLNHVVTPDDPGTDPERIIRFSRLFNNTDAYTWSNDFLNAGELDGMFGANLPVTVPLVSPFTVRAFWDLQDPANPYFEFPTNLGTQLGMSNSCNLPGIVAGIHSLLDSVESGLKSDILEKLPLIGDLDLDQAGVFVHDVRQVVDPLLLALGSSTALRSYLFENLGPGTLTGTGLKLDILENVTSLNDIGIGSGSGMGTWVNVPTSGLECAQLNLHLGGQFQVDADFDLGLSAINFDVNTTGGVVLTADYDVQVGFGLNKATGAYVMLNTSPSDPEIELGLSVGLAPNTALDLRLFFLQLSAAEGVDPTETTGLQLDVMIDIVGPTNPARLTFQEIAQTPLKDLASIDIQGGVTVDLTLTAGTTNPALPSIKADLYVGWMFAFSDSEPFEGSQVTVQFRNLRVDLGGYLTKVLKPIVQRIDESLKPLDPLINFLKKEVPLVSDASTLVGQDPITVLDMARLFGEGYESAFDFIELIIDIRQIASDLAATPSGTTFEIVFGNFMMGSTGGLVDPRDPNANVNPMASPPAAFSGTAQDVDTVIANNSGSGGQIASILATLRGFGVEFPLLDNPASAFGILFGQPVDFVTYDLLGPGLHDRLEATFSWSQNFGPILPPIPLYAQIGAEFTMFADLKVG
ncbi:MAG TPA: hypothetical protein VIY86_13355, partial [Pirellulaceae bacterium]